MSTETESLRILDLEYLARRKLWRGCYHPPLHVRSRRTAHRRSAFIPGASALHDQTWTFNNEI